MTKTKTIFILLLCLTVFWVIGYSPILNNSKNSDLQFTEYNPNGTKTIVMLHGIPTTETLYGPLSQQLVENNWHIIIPHLYGNFGLNPTDDASAIANLLENLETGPVHVMVHDRGGLVLWEILDTKPEIVSEITILNTIGDSFDAPFSTDYLGRIMISILYSNLGPGNNMVKQTLSMGGADNQTIIENIAIEIRNSGYKHLRYFFKNFDDIEANMDRYRQAMRDYTGKVSIIWGMQDPFLDHQIHLNALIDNFNIEDNQVIKIEDATHYLPLTQINTIITNLR